MVVVFNILTLKMAVFLKLCLIALFHPLVFCNTSNDELVPLVIWPGMGKREREGLCNKKINCRLIIIYVRRQLLLSVWGLRF